jgi:hypothetical protein
VLAEPHLYRKHPGGFAMCSFMIKFLRAPRAEFMAAKLILLPSAHDRCLRRSREEWNGASGGVVSKAVGGRGPPERANTNVNGCDGGLVIGERAGSDAATAGAARDGDVGVKGNRTGVVGQAVAGH